MLLLPLNSSAPKSQSRLWLEISRFLGLVPQFLIPNLEIQASAVMFGLVDRVYFAGRGDGQDCDYEGGHEPFPIWVVRKLISFHQKLGLRLKKLRILFWVRFSLKIVSGGLLFGVERIFDHGINLGTIQGEYESTE